MAQSRIAEHTFMMLIISPLPAGKKNMPLYQIQEASAKLLSSFSYHVLNQKPPSDREFQRANTALNVLVRGHL